MQVPALESTQDGQQKEASLTHLSHPPSPVRPVHTTFPRVVVVHCSFTDGKRLKATSRLRCSRICIVASILLIVIISLALIFALNATDTVHAERLPSGSSPHSKVAQY